MNDEIKSELDKMDAVYMIRRVTEANDLVSNFSFSRKRDGMITIIFLDPKYIIYLIKRCH